MNKNIVLLIGAKGSDQPVVGAVDELFEIKEAFKDKEKGREFQVEYESTLTSKILESVLSNFRNDIRIIHFAGHSNAGGIYLHDGELSIQLIINYIRNWSNKPSMVFINGCNSSGQVDGFLEAGVACVIATHNPINDEKAEKFAINFYRELLSTQQELSFRTAFNDAGVFLKDGGDFSPRTLDIEEVGLIDNQQFAWDWGIFTKKTKWEDENTISSILDKLPSYETVKPSAKVESENSVGRGISRKMIFLTAGLLAVLTAAFFIPKLINGEPHLTSNPSNPSSDTPLRFHDPENGTIIDNTTKLMWKKCSEGQSGKHCDSGEIEKYTWGDAMAKFDKVKFLEHSDWRLPTIKELRTLIHCDNGTPVTVSLKHGCIGENASNGQFSAPTINKILFPRSGAGRYWSSDTSQQLNFKAWVVSFYDGKHSDLDKSKSKRVRLVRRIE